MTTGEQRARQADAQGAAEHMAALLSVLGVGSGGENVVSITENGRLSFDPDIVYEIYNVLTDFLPRCWTAHVYYGYDSPEGCTMPNSLCAACVGEARRLPSGHPLNDAAGTGRAGRAADS